MLFIVGVHVVCEINKTEKVLFLFIVEVNYSLCRPMKFLGSNSIEVDGFLQDMKISNTSPPVEKPELLKFIKGHHAKKSLCKISRPF